tara:strand:+ start:1965 stop:2372 length:408 start_codon:yes stop_codon:yes gene_type:complete
MSTVFNDIQAALDARLNTMTGSYDIAWPNTPYEPVANTTYLRPTFLPSETLQASLGVTGKDFTVGIYQIDIFTVSGTGRTAISDTIADHFKRGTSLTYNGKTLRVQSVSILPAVIDGSWQQVPISISFYTYTDAR